MALESVTNVNDLVKANPTLSDKRHQGDDHIRNIKKALLAGMNGVLGMAAVVPTPLTISGGTITPAADTNSFFSLTGQTIPDTLDTIAHTDLYNGGFILIKNAGTDSITLSHNTSGTDDLIHQGATDIILTNTDQYVLYYVDKAASKTYEVFRSASLMLPLPATESAASPSTPASGSATIYAYDTGKELTESGTGSTEIGLLDDQGFLIRLTQSATILTDAAHDMSGYSLPEISATLLITPTATRIITLPKTKVPKGWKVQIINLSTTIGLTIDVDGATTIFDLGPEGRVTFTANRDTPTSGAHWLVDNANRFDTIIAAFTSASSEVVVLTQGAAAYQPSFTSDVGLPSLNYYLKLPTTFIKAGQEVTIITDDMTNMVTEPDYDPDKWIIIQSSAGTDVCTLFRNSWITFKALQDTPTSPAHWIAVGHSPVMLRVMDESISPGATITSSIEIPNGIGKVTARLVGGGGGGASSTSNGDESGGGGGGGIVEASLFVLGASTLNFRCGAGGAAQASGTDSYVDIDAAQTHTAQGGIGTSTVNGGAGGGAPLRLDAAAAGGAAGTSNGGGGGQTQGGGAGGAGGSTVFAAGGAGGAQDTNGGGGGGGASVGAGGVGGAGKAAAPALTDTNKPGGGGGGGGEANNSTNRLGTAGAPGAVYISY